jgi:hypothetical protein
VTQKVSNTDRYAATPDQMIEMMAKPDYLTAKYEALGDIEFKVEDQTVSDGGLNLKISRVVSANLPDLAKKVLGESSELIQEENWSTAGADKTANITIDSPGKPVKIHGTAEIKPVGDAECDYTVKFEIKASIPLVGGKIEKMVAAETKGNFVKEKGFNESYLSAS